MGATESGGGVWLPELVKEATPLKQRSRVAGWQVDDPQQDAQWKSFPTEFDEDGRWDFKIDKTGARSAEHEAGFLDRARRSAPHPRTCPDILGHFLTWQNPWPGLDINQGR